jgi:hypothetical protein
MELENIKEGDVICLVEHEKSISRWMEFKEFLYEKGLAAVPMPFSEDNKFGHKAIIVNIELAIKEYHP